MMLKFSECLGKEKMLKYAKKSLVSLVGVSLVASSVPKVAFAEGEIPDEVFVTKERLFQICSGTNDGQGLLKTGADSDKLIRVNWGMRPCEVHDCLSDTAVAKEGPISWLVAGGDRNGNIVLYSEDPILKSEFQIIPANGYAEDKNGGDWKSDSYSPSIVHYNHWGQSELRNKLKNLISGDNTDYFKDSEKKLMLKSTVKTLDWLNKTGNVPCEYETEDTLYAPRSKTSQRSKAAHVSDITVGENDDLKISKVYCKIKHWLRSPCPETWNYYYALVTCPDDRVFVSRVDYDYPVVCAAFKLNMDSILFASSALIEGEGYAEITKGTQMTLRLDGSEQNMGQCEITADRKVIHVESAGGSTLVVQGTKADGTNWSYRKTIASSDEVSVKAEEIYEAGNIELCSFSNCEVWLEKSVEAGSSLTYAVRATEKED